MKGEPTNHISIDDFARNLQTLCTAHRSVSEVCRLTGINRQQFGRYLKGSYRPSRFNLRRICEIFDIHESQLMLPAEEFETFFNSRQLETQKGGITGLLGTNLGTQMTMTDPSLRKYIGWYHCYAYSFGWSNWVIRSLVSIYEHQGRILCKRIERVKDPVYSERFVYKFGGYVSTSGDRIFIVEQDLLQLSGLTFKILFCNHRSHVDFLSGLVTGTSMRTDNSPTSARVALEYMGSSVDVRTELKKCGMFVPTRHNINPKILSMINNTFAEGETALHAVPR